MHDIEDDDDLEAFNPPTRGLTKMVMTIMLMVSTHGNY